MDESAGTEAAGTEAAGTPAPRRGSAAGDGGETDLLGRRRVPKHDPRVEAIGLIDEATSLLGLARPAAREARTRRLVQQIQQDLYDVMAELAFPPDHPQGQRIGAAHVGWLDRCTERVQAPFLALNAFVLPGACPGSAALDVARAAVRTAERQLSRLGAGGLLPNATSLAYLNRLSLLLYYLARAEDAAAGVDFELAGASSALAR
jgi:cob(I)alamin adenosyltransferase